MPPASLPVFRSDGQARLLAEIFLHAPPMGLRLTDLAERVALSAGTAHREVNRLERAGIVRSERVGRERRVFADETSPYHTELRSLLLKAFGPVMVLAEQLAAIDGAAEAFVFGSWARRYDGEPGDPPGDIDLLVIGTAAPDDVYAACRRAERRLGLAVNPTILSEAEWHGDSGFLRRLRGGALVRVFGAEV